MEVVLKCHCKDVLFLVLSVSYILLNNTLYSTAVTWLKYCGYSIKLSNQSINLIFYIFSVIYLSTHHMKVAKTMAYHEKRVHRSKISINVFIYIVQSGLKSCSIAPDVRYCHGRVVLVNCRNKHGPCSRQCQLTYTVSIDRFISV